MSAAGARAARLAGAAIVAGLFAMLALNLVWVVRHRDALGGMSAGGAAPEVSLPLLDGGRLQLAAERGHVVVLSFWATWCGPCVGELPDVDRLARELAPGVRIIAVNLDGGAPDEVRPTVTAFRQRLGLTLPIALDDGEAAARYHVDTIPHTVVIDAAGRVRRVLDGAHSYDEMRRAIDDARATREP